MNTITSYKLVFIDLYGDLQDRDFGSEAEARTFAANNNITDYEIYVVKMIGSITKL